MGAAYRAQAPSHCRGLKSALKIGFKNRGGSPLVHLRFICTSFLNACINIVYKFRVEILEN
jgi:hypothetical protein